MAELRKKLRRKRARLGTALSDVSRESAGASQGLYPGDEFGHSEPMEVDEININHSQFAESGDKNAGASEVNYQSPVRPQALKQLLYSLAQLL